MEFIVDRVKKEIEEEEVKAIYSPYDIEELIVKDLQKRGCNASKIIFSCKVVNKSDPWGNVIYTTAELDEVVAIIE